MKIIRMKTHFGNEPVMIFEKKTNEHEQMKTNYVF
jgi:hypothetical protein